MKTLVKMPFFRLALLVLVITILGLLLQKYVVNRERFFYTNGNSAFAVPVGLNQDGNIMFKLTSEFKDESDSNGNVTDKIIKNLKVWKKKDGSNNEFEDETKNISMCQLCYKKTINDEEKCMYDVWNKTQETKNDGTTSDKYNRTKEQGCPNFCDTNRCPETPVINIVVPNSSGGESSNKGSSTSADKNAGTTVTSNYPSTFSGSLNHLSKIMNQKLAENTIRVSGNEVKSSMNVVDKLEELLSDAELKEVNTFRNFSYDGSINTPVPFDTSYKPQMGSSSLSEISKYRNYL